MKKVLWISLRAPYDKVAHAGGKVHNYYIKKFNESKKFDIHLLSFCYKDELMKLDLKEYGIRHEIAVINKNEKIRNLLNKVALPISLIEYIFIRRKIKESVRKLKKEGYNPDTVILQWTEIILLLPFIQNFFRKSKFVSIEEDVTFLKMNRKVNRSNGIKKIIFIVQERILKKAEVNSLKCSDLVVLNNNKDRDLVIENGIKKSKTYVTVPFFNNLGNKIERVPGKDILFWGAMNRSENIEAVKWFIEKVMPNLSGTRLIVLGANPPNYLHSSEKVVITGYVEDVKEYFATCLCMVVPLRMGAGVKIKVLEGMAAGIPILTNDIGIEGIPAKREVEYLHCEEAGKYVESIRMLRNDNEMVKNIGKNAKEFIWKNYDITRNIQNFIERVDKL